MEARVAKKGCSGLGLRLSYDIVTQGHGGSLTVESEEGKGATFIAAGALGHGTFTGQGVAFVAGNDSL